MLPAAILTEAANTPLPEKQSKVAFTDDAEWIYYEPPEEAISSGDSGLTSFDSEDENEDADVAGTSTSMRVVLDAQTPRVSKMALPEFAFTSPLEDCFDAKTPRRTGAALSGFDFGEDSFGCEDEASSDREEDVPRVSEALDAKTPRTRRSAPPTFDLVFAEDM